MTEPEFASATLPMFAAGEVDCIEWTFDVGWGSEGIPDWCDDLLSTYSAEGRLFGHGVSYSPLTAQWQERQEQWLDRLNQEVATRNYRHITEHFGFMSAGDFHRSAPLPVPMNEETIAIGQDRLRKLADASGCTVGLENLAFAFGVQDVENQGAFLDALLRPVDGILLLDLHNIYCHACNFDSSAQELLANYPLDLVREIHLSGGSWSSSSVDDGEPIRRDTHDDQVPERLFSDLEWILGQCPKIEVVILERLGNTLSERSAERFRADYLCIKEVVNRACHA
jgi:hypothetical protein